MLPSITGHNVVCAERPPTRRNGVRAETVSTAAETKINVACNMWYGLSG
jgi:hypothetical protein